MIPTSATPIVGLSQLAGTLARQSLDPGGGKSAQVEDKEIRPAGNTVVAENNVKPSSEEESKPDLGQLSEAVAELQQRSSLVNKKLQFEVIDSSNQLQVLVIDADTEEVIREIPPEEAIKLAERIRENLGLVLDTLA
jgi:flagellar protein FlaG